MNNSKNGKALTIANVLVRQGVSRSEAMHRAWRTAKQRVIHTNTAGVTRGNRQTLLYRLDTVQRRPDKRNAPQGAGERSGQERRAGYSHC